MRGFLAPLLLLAAAPAGAAEDDVVLFFCQESLDGECPALLDALRRELGDLGLDVWEGSLKDKLELGIQLPPAVVSETRESGAVAAVWLARDGDGASLLVYTPGCLENVSKIVVDLEEGWLDSGDAAFRVRTVLGASLYPELPDIQIPEVEQGTPGQAVDDEIPSIEKEVAASRPGRQWVRLEGGYALVGYPTRSYWYHGISLRAGVLALPALEIFVDADVTFPLSRRYRWNASSIGFVNSQYLIGVGAGYTFTIVGPLSLTPLAGFHVGVSDTLVDAEEQTRHREVNTSLWMGLEIRLSPARWVSFLVNASIENLFNYEYFEWDTPGDDNRVVFALAQIRIGVVAGACFSF